jgi:hypothetical protein
MAVIGLWGPFADGDLGHRLFPRVAAAELGRRVPDLELRIWAPSRAADLPFGIEPLGEWSEDRLDELAACMQVLVLLPAGLGAFEAGLGRREALVPTVRLSEADVVAACGLARRVFDDEPLEARIARLRSLGSYPEGEAAIATDPKDANGMEPVELESLPGDLEDRVAAIAWSGGVSGRSTAAVRAVALSFGRPVIGARAEAPEAVAARGDDVFERIAAIAAGGPPNADVPEAADGYTRALAARLVAQHAAFAERERALLDLIEGLTREINEKDIRFTRLWQKLHKADRLYNWHINRADFYEELAVRRQDELDRLRLLGPLRSRLRRKLARTWFGRLLAKALRAVRGKRR